MTLKGLFNAIHHSLNKPDERVSCKIDFGSKQLNGLFGSIDENGQCTPDHGITEIVGDPGSGKSQLLMNLTASILSCNPEVSVLYIDTENCITRMRIQEMMATPLTRHQLILLDVLDHRELSLLISSLDELLGLRRDIRVVIIDSIGYPGRLAIHLGHNQLPSRWSSSLNSLCDKYNLVTFVSNHTTLFRWRGLHPSLGTRWHRDHARRIWLHKPKYTDARITITTIKTSGILTSPIDILITETGIKTLAPTM